jgi:hypothetical protein
MHLTTILSLLVRFYRSYRYAPVLLAIAGVLTCGAITAGVVQVASVIEGSRSNKASGSADDIAFSGEVPYGISSSSFDNRQSDDDNETSSSDGTVIQKNSGTTKNNSSSGRSTNGATRNTQSNIKSAAVSLRALIPQSGTVLTLNGLNLNITNYVPDAFGGIFSKPPYTLNKVQYPASFASDSISKGVTALNNAVRSTPGQKIVLAHSQGSQVASNWMRQYAIDPSAPGANELTFILFGNPLRSDGGYLIGRPEIGHTTGLPTPTNTKWPIIDVTRRYEGWSDWVKDESNKWAVDNAKAGKLKTHPRYDQVDIYSQANTVWQSGNTTYVLTKEDDLPLWKDNSEYPFSVRQAMRAYIERAYNRPANDPQTILLPVEPAWQNQLREWGIPY